MGELRSVEDVLAISSGFQRSCILIAAVDHDVFGLLGDQRLTADEVAGRLGADQRSVAALLDALAALKLVAKQDGRYSVPPDVADLLTAEGEHSLLAMVRHHGNCMRRWVQLPEVMLSGKPAQAGASIRGEDADKAAFIEAMDNVSGPMADEVIGAIDRLDFKHLLDVGGASGTWTLSFLRSVPDAVATVFDLPHVIPMAKQRIEEAGAADRVTLIAGDFYTDPLPGGVDFAWVSAIVHQNSREQNRALFESVFNALTPGGRIAIRDILMHEDRTSPVGGALFAINMLVATDRGGTFTFDELRQDLEAAGFVDVAIARHDQWMNSIVVGRKAT